MDENTISRSDAEESRTASNTREEESAAGSGQKLENQEYGAAEEQSTPAEREGHSAEQERRTENRRAGRTGAENGSGSRRAGRTGAENREGSRRADRTGTENREGSRRTGRTGAENREGSRRVSRTETENRAGSRRVNRTETENRAGSRRVSRTETENGAGSRRVNRTEAENGAEGRRVSHTDARYREEHDTAAEQTASLQERHVPSEREENSVREHETQSGKFGLGHKKTRRSAIVYLFEDIGDAFVRAKNWCVKNYRTSIPAAICLVLVIIVACILVRNYRQQPAPVSEDTEQTVEYPLEQDAYEHVNLFFKKYYEACSFGDVDTYVSMRSFTNDTECIKMQKKANYIDYYLNLSCYTKPGPVDNTYIVYVYYEVKFRGINTLAPGLKTFYLCTNDAGELYIYTGEVDQNVRDYMRTVSLQEDVRDLFNRVKIMYNNAVASDKELEDFLAVLSENLTNEVEQALKELEMQNQTAANETDLPAPEEPTPTPEEPEPTPEPEPQTDMVMTTNRVNVRSSASPEATKVGTVAAGTQFTRYESLENGWSKIDYEGSEAYIKTEYLQVIEATTGTVRTIDSVNIRASASEDATKLGTVSAGTTLDLIEHQENGWSRILFNGMTAYVKTEFVE